MTAADHLREAIDVGCTRDDHDHIADHRAEVIAERDTEIIKWLGKKAREYRAAGGRDCGLQAHTVSVMASKLARGAVRANNTLTLPATATTEPDLHDAILTAVQSFQASADDSRAGTSYHQQLAQHILTAVAPLVPYREIWSGDLPPGGRCCSICGQPVESEPCPEHAPEAGKITAPSGETTQPAGAAGFFGMAKADDGGHVITVWRDPHPKGHVPIALKTLHADEWSPDAASELLLTTYGYVTAPGSYWQPMSEGRYGIRLRRATEDGAR